MGWGEKLWSLSHRFAHFLGIFFSSLCLTKKRIPSSYSFLVFPPPLPHLTNRKVKQASLIQISLHQSLRARITQQCRSPPSCEQHWNPKTRQGQDKQKGRSQSTHSQPTKKQKPTGLPTPSRLHRLPGSRKLPVGWVAPVLNKSAERSAIPGVRVAELNRRSGMRLFSGRRAIPDLKDFLSLSLQHHKIRPSSAHSRNRKRMPVRRPQCLSLLSLPRYPALDASQKI